MPTTTGLTGCSSCTLPFKQKKTPKKRNYSLHTPASLLSLTIPLQSTHEAAEEVPSSSMQKHLKVKRLRKKTSAQPFVLMQAAVLASGLLTTVPPRASMSLVSWALVLLSLPTTTNLRSSSGLLVLGLHTDRKKQTSIG